MKTKHLISFVGGLLLVLQVLVVRAEIPSLQATRIDSIVVDLMKSQGIPGVSVAVATGNTLMYAKGFGSADVENQVPVTTQTSFRTASIAKSLTAAVVMELVEQGTIDLDADVQRYCPDYGEKQWKVTSRQLLGHLGGVRHYQKPNESSSTEHFYSLSSALAQFRDDPLVTRPGTKYLYSTFGYNLLGSVVEGASGKGFVDLLEECVLLPAGMTHTVVDSQHAVISDRARGYMRPTQEELRSLPAGHDLKVGQLYNSKLHDTSMKIPGGGLLSTPTDLVRFATALNAGKLLSNQSLQQMWTSQETTGGEPTNYGFGWRIEYRAGRKVVSHTGGQSGTSTILVLVPETGTALAVMCNLQHASLTTVAQRIADVVQPPPKSSTADFDKALQKLAEAVSYEVREKELPALSMSLVAGNQVIWARGFGFQDPERRYPATAETVYRVGSVSKLFTDIAIMQQVEHGKLDLDTPVQHYLADFNPRGAASKGITLRQLMSHQSGLVRESPVGNYFDPTQPSLAETVASLNSTELVYEPGSKTKYSNAAIAVVGSVLEQSLSVSHEEYVRSAILEPLKMQDSSFSLTDGVREKLAMGWMRTYDGRRFTAPGFLLGTGPAGNMFSSVLDLSKFIVCLFNEGATPSGSLLQPVTFQSMTARSLDAAGVPQNFGIGFQIQDFDGEVKIGHGGAVYGFSTQLEVLPERKIGVAAVAALDGSNGVVQRLSEFALRLMKAAQDGQPLPEYRKTTTIAPERSRALVGSYQTTSGDRRAEITELDGRVYLQRGSYRYELRSAVDDSSILTDDAIGFGAEVKQLSEARIEIGDATYEKVVDGVPQDIPARWLGLIGEYGWDHNTLYILEDRGRLTALIEWFYYYPLTEVDEDTFLFPDYGLYHGEGLKFSRDKDGRANQVVAAEVKFLRREVGTKDGETFKIAPVKPIDSLRSAALAAVPPAESGEHKIADLVELTTLDSNLQLDIRYATTNNFTGAVFYKQPRAFMQRPAAEAVVRANQRLKQHGLGLLIHDAYRPWHVTKMFWDATPAELKDFVANPASGSRHNRGCAVDLTLFDLASGKPIQMVAGYDEFSNRSLPQYPGGTARQRWYRDLLRATMQAEGFRVYEFEWWHFDYQDWKLYRIQNIPFEELGP